MSRGIMYLGYGRMQNLMPVLLATLHAAAAFPHYERGWGEVTCPILPKPFLLISLLAGTLPPNSLDHRPLLITLHCRPGWGDLVKGG